MTVTSQAAERIYRATGTETGAVTLSAEISPKGRLDWLPQETILFDHGRLKRRFDFSLAEDATLLCVEPLVFGREAMGEAVQTAHLHDIWRVKSGGKLVFADALKLDGPVAKLLARPAIASGHRALANVLLVSPDTEAKLAKTRQLLGTSGGASIIRPGVLVVRLMAPNSFLLRKTLVPILEWLKGGPIPKTWNI